MPPLGTPVNRLASSVRVRRGELGLSVDEAARRGSISAVTWTRVERGQPVRNVSYRGIERALGWSLGSADAIMEGGDPTPDVRGDVTRGAGGADDQSSRHSSQSDIMISAIWNSDLPDDDKLELIEVLRAERNEADRRVMDRLVERKRLRQRYAS